jgi:hypothetical protein
VWGMSLTAHKIKSPPFSCTKRERKKNTKKFEF